MSLGVGALVALNLGYAVMGTVFVWAVRGMPRWSDVARLCGLGYLVGVAAFGVLWTELLVLGVPFGRWQVVATLVLGTGLSAAVGAWRLMPLPQRTSSAPSGTTTSLLVTAVGIALVGLLFEAFFRSARLQSVQAFDAWAFWIPKAKAIYFFGGFDEQIFTVSAGPTYPPLLPILDATAFHAMGSADVVTVASTTSRASPSRRRSTSSSGFSCSAARWRLPDASRDTSPPGRSGRPCSSCSPCLGSARN